VVVSTQRQDGGGRAFVALEDAELLDLRPAGSGEYAQAGSGGAPAPTALATLRVSSRQAVYLTAAVSFSRTIRLLVRPPGDRRRVGAVAVEEGEL
jgi:pilus assembly protein CpaB